MLYLPASSARGTRSRGAKPPSRSSATFAFGVEYDRIETAQYTPEWVAIGLHAELKF